MDKTTKESFQLMLGGPIQMANSRIGRARKEKRENVAILWKDASDKLQAALFACAQAAQADEPVR